nr:unnamed protein product [Spirometra erinaceieuropaei]
MSEEEKSLGLEQIPAKARKELACKLFRPLSNISHSSFYTDILPPDRKMDIELNKLADDRPSLQKQTAIPSSRSPPRSSARNIQSAYSVRLNVAAAC